jgi:hypothetical protein
MVRCFTRPTRPGCLAFSLGSLASFALGQGHELYLGSAGTVVSKGHPIVSNQQVIGACGGSVQSMTVSLGDLVVGTTTGALYRNSPQGLQFWFQAANDARSMAAFGADLFVGGTDGSIVRYDYPSGVPETIFQAGVAVQSLLAADNGKLYAGTPFGAVLEGDPLGGDFQFFGTCGGSALGMAEVGNQLFIADSSQLLWTFDLTTKQLVNSQALGFTPSGMVAFDGDLLIGSPDGKLRRVDRHTAALKQTQTQFFSVEAMALNLWPAPGFAYCFGSTCPCGNDDVENACVNSTGFGSGLTADGTASVALDNLTLTAFDLPASVTTIFYTSPIPNNAPFGDGLLCVGAGGYPTFRFAVDNSGPTGIVRLGPGIVAYLDATFGTGVAFPGASLHFQAWFRDPMGPCGATFNTTSAYKVTYAP